MPKPKVLALVLAGGEGSRLELLTERRAKPALPFAGVYRLIDFPLSNCVHSGIEDVWVLQQYRVQSLNDQLANGRPWDLDRTYGGLRLLPPQLGAEEDGFHEGNADAIWRNRQLIAEREPEVVLVLSADHVYRLDYGEVLARHRDQRAGVTVVTSEVPEQEASRQAVVEVGGDGRLRGFHYKPEEPPTTRVATEVFAFATDRLLGTLEELAAGDGELKDFGHGLLPRLVEAGEAVEFRMAGYWRDVGTVPAYWQAHMDLLDPERPLELDDPDWPVLGRSPHRLPARVEGSARLDGALLSPGTVVCGEVARSVLGSGVVVEPGAVVRDAVLLDDCVVGSGATVEGAVLDRGARVGPDATVGGPGGEGPALVAEEASIPKGTTVQPGGRFSTDDGERVGPG
jgi:glucose-1-phosphate adenylyltransferase